MPNFFEGLEPRLLMSGTPVAPITTSVVELSAVAVNLAVENQDQMPPGEFADAFSFVLTGNPGNLVTASIDPFTGTMLIQGLTDVQPPLNFEILRYEFFDTAGNQYMGEVIVDVLDLAPVTGPDSFSVNEDGIVFGFVLANDFDNDNEELTAQLVSAPDVGRYRWLDDGRFWFQPRGEVTGAVAFVYDCVDSMGSVTREVVQIDVGANTPPVAVEDTYETFAGGQFAVPASAGLLANDTDAEGGNLTAHLWTPPRRGSLTLFPDGRFVYVAASGFVGTDTFRYFANDGSAISNLATVTIQVQSLDGLFAGAIVQGRDHEWSSLL